MRRPPPPLSTQNRCSEWSKVSQRCGKASSNSPPVKKVSLCWGKPWTGSLPVKIRWRTRSIRCSPPTRKSLRKSQRLRRRPRPPPRANIQHGNWRPRLSGAAERECGVARLLTNCRFPLHLTECVIGILSCSAHCREREVAARQTAKTIEIGHDTRIHHAALYRQLPRNVAVLCQQRKSPARRLVA
jgi:hypothetical protein